MLLLKEEFHVAYENEKTNIGFPFTVPEGTQSLKITFSYDPKILEDDERANLLIENNIKKDADDFAGEYTNWDQYKPLKNLITVSVDDPDSYRGCAHRQDKDQVHIIREDFASRGFRKGRPEAGQWKVVLNLHGIVTEKVNCRLEVEAGDFYE